MIWQAALFERFIFHKVNTCYELKLGAVRKWVADRFCTDRRSPQAVQREVSR